MINATNERHQTPKIAKFQPKLKKCLNLTGYQLHRNEV